MNLAGGLLIKQPSHFKASRHRQTDGAQLAISFKSIVNLPPSFVSWQQAAALGCSGLL